MFERQHEDLYIDSSWDDDDYMPSYNDEWDIDEGWYEDDYDYLDEDLDDYSDDEEF